VQLVGQIESPKNLDGIGTEVDAGAKLRKLSGLLINLHLKALTAKRNGRRQPAKAGANHRDPTHASHIIHIVRRGAACRKS
jgi:hypothetical protein